MTNAPKILGTDTLRQAYPKINQAIDNANEALSKATNAETNSTNAVNTANSVQQQLNQIVIEGDSSVEAAQARVDAEGNVYTTLKERIDAEQTKIGILSNVIVSAEKYGVKADGTDQSAKIANAIAACPTGGTLIFPKGEYIGKVVITKPITIDFMGSKITPPNGEDKIIQAVGTQGTSNYILDSPVTRGDKVLTLTSVPTDIVAGDLIVLRDDTTRVSDGQTDVNLEVHEVYSVDTVAKTIILKDFVRLPKSVSSSCNVYKIIPIKGIKIRNINLQAVNGAINNHGLYFDMCQDVKLENITMTKSVAPVISFRRSYNCLVDWFNIYQAQATGGGQGYGVQATLGSSNITIRNGYGDGLRHTVDCGNSFDVLVDNVKSVNCDYSHFVLSHNGWDADITFRDCKSYGGTGYAYQFSSQGVSDPYALKAHNIKIIRPKGVIDNNGFAIGIYINAPMEDCYFEDIDFVFKNGASVDTVNSSHAFRCLPVNNKNTTVNNFKAKGFRYGIFLYHSDSKTPTNPLDHIKFKNIWLENCDYGYYAQFASAIHLENVQMDNINTNHIYIHSTPTGAKIRYLVLKNISLKNYTAGKFLRWTEDARDSNGILGEISNIHANTTTDGNLSVTAGQALTLEDILLNKNGEVIRMAAISPITMNAEPFPKGLVEGQRMILLSVGSDITIPDGVNNLNSGGGNIVIGSAKRGAEFVWSGAVWIQVA
jgi:hypothetical protein